MASVTVQKSNFGRPTPSTRRASVAASARWRGDSTQSARRCPRDLTHWMISTQVGEMMSLLVVAIWCLIAYGLFLLMRNIYHVFLEAVDPEQKAHASLRRRGPKILARLKRAASSFRRPKEPQEPDLAATAEAARNQLALVPVKAAPTVDRPLTELSPEGVAAWLFLQELPGDPADVDALGEVVRDRGVSGAEFARLDADELKAMGVGTLGLRKAILRKIREDAAAQRAAAADPRICEDPRRLRQLRRRQQGALLEAQLDVDATRIVIALP